MIRRLVQLLAMRDVVMVLVGTLLGTLLSGLVSLHFYRRASQDSAEQESRTIARHVVAAMLPQHPAKDSKEFEDRVQRYLAALTQARADGRGVPVYRQDGTIAVDWSLSFNEALQTTERLAQRK